MAKHKNWHSARANDFEKKLKAKNSSTYVCICYDVFMRTIKTTVNDNSVEDFINSTTNG